MAHAIAARWHSAKGWCCEVGKALLCKQHPTCHQSVWSSYGTFKLEQVLFLIHYCLARVVTEASSKKIFCLQSIGTFIEHVNWMPIFKQKIDAPRLPDLMNAALTTYPTMETSKQRHFHRLHTITRPWISCVRLDGPRQLISFALGAIYNTSYDYAASSFRKVVRLEAPMLLCRIVVINLLSLPGPKLRICQPAYVLHILFIQRRQEHMLGWPSI